MFVSAHELRPGDIIQINSRSPCWLDEHEAIVERWIRAEVVDCEPGAWPLARLADGQLTDGAFLHALAIRRQRRSRSPDRWAA